jgi:hypothetical protein
MKAISYSIILMLVIFGFCTAVPAIHETIPAESQVPLPKPEAAELYTYIANQNPYTKWQMWPGKGKLYKGTEPHGALLTTYVNEFAHRSASQKTRMPDGAMIVKENYTADGKLSALSVMYKVKGYNPDKGDWFWGQYDPDGSVKAAGRIDSCIACHEKRKDNDYIFTGPLK